MNLILNVNELGYEPFLNSQIDSFIISLKKYSEGQLYKLNFKQVNLAINKIKEVNKKVYLNINLLLTEKELIKFKKDFHKIINLNVDAFIISDLGMLNLFKEENLLNKVIFQPDTYITNMYSANFFVNLGVKRIVLANELQLEEILLINEYVNNKVEIMVEGYPKISSSKRKLLSIYFKYYKLNKNKKLYYLKEEKRDNALPVFEDDKGMYVYHYENISYLENLDELLNNKLLNLRIDAFNKSEAEILTLIEQYKKEEENV